MDRYRNRRQAAQILAKHLEEYRDRPDLLVLALPRGGVPIGFEIARAFRAELDVLIVRKLGLPGAEELAMGAIATGGVVVLNPEIATLVSDEAVRRVADRELRELRRRESLFSGHRPPPRFRGRCVIIVDDGLATGATMRAAAEVVRRHGAQEVVIAVPVGPRETILSLRREADRVVCPKIPEPFQGVGQWYDDFEPTSDEEVRALLEASRQAAEEAAIPRDADHA